MTNLIAARFMMAFTLAFHMVFALLGIGLPFLAFIAEGLHLKTGDAVFNAIARRWGKAIGVLFAVGAVSGTVISFELGLLWPRFMAFAGPVIGLPFTLESIAFFLEALFLGVYLYGWDRVSPRVHWGMTGGVVFFAALSGVLVVTANGWMNTPAGFELVEGMPAHIRVWAAMFNPAALTEVVHNTIAVFAAAAGLVAAVHAFGLLKNPESAFQRSALKISFAVFALAALAVAGTGDMSARFVAKAEPIKLAALEGQWETQAGAPLRIGGFPDEKSETTRYAIEIPYGLSLLAFHNPQAEVIGLKSVPPQDRPPVLITHLAFQIMVGCGSAMAAMAGWAVFLLARRRRFPDNPWFLRAVVLTGPLGLVALQAGWIVTEVGRQPWIISNVMRTAEAVTTTPHLIVPLAGFVALYLVLGITTALVLAGIGKETR